MLRLLLDEHLSPVVAQQLTAVRPDIEIVSIYHWKGGRYEEADDDVLLRAAHEDGMTLVTYDQATIPPLLVTWGEEGTSHSGVILINRRTIAPNDFGGLIRALTRLWDRTQALDWTNRMVYLTP